MISDVKTPVFLVAWEVLAPRRHPRDTLVERTYTPHMVLSARDQFRAVLASALASGDAELEAEARSTISILYAQRHTEFNDLLD